MNWISENASFENFNSQENGPEAFDAKRNEKKIALADQEKNKFENALGKYDEKISELNTEIGKMEEVVYKIMQQKAQFSEGTAEFEKLTIGLNEKTTQLNDLREQLDAIENAKNNLQLNSKIQTQYVQELKKDSLAHKNNLSETSKQTTHENEVDLDKSMSDQIFTVENVVNAIVDEKVAEEKMKINEKSEWNEKANISKTILEKIDKALLNDELNNESRLFIEFLKSEGKTKEQYEWLSEQQKIELKHNSIQYIIEKQKEKASRANLESLAHRFDDINGMRNNRDFFTKRWITVENLDSIFGMWEENKKLKEDLASYLKNPNSVNWPELYDLLKNLRKIQFKEFLESATPWSPQEKKFKDVVDKRYKELFPNSWPLTEDWYESYKHEYWFEILGEASKDLINPNWKVTSLLQKDVRDNMSIDVIESLVQDSIAKSNGETNTEKIKIDYSQTTNAISKVQNREYYQAAAEFERSYTISHNWQSSSEVIYNQIRTNTVTAPSANTHSINFEQTSSLGLSDNLSSFNSVSLSLSKSNPDNKITLKKDPSTEKVDIEVFWKKFTISAEKATENYLKMFIEMAKNPLFSRILKSSDPQTLMYFEKEFAKNEKFWTEKIGDYPHHFYEMILGKISEATGQEWLKISGQEAITKFNNRLEDPKNEKSLVDFLTQKGIIGLDWWIVISKMISPTNQKSESLESEKISKNPEIIDPISASV